MKKTVMRLWVVATLAAGCGHASALHESEAKPAVAASRPSLAEITASLRELIMTGFSVDSKDLIEAMAPSDAGEVPIELDTAELPVAVDSDPELAQKAQELHAMFDRHFPASAN